MASVAQKRWKLLGSAIREAAAAAGKAADAASAGEQGDGADVSVRKFSTFGLFTVTPASNVDSGSDSSSGSGSSSAGQDGGGGGGEWMHFAMRRAGGDGSSGSSLHGAGQVNADRVVAFLVWQPHVRVSLRDMMGFNNTGNVCVWPSEEVLAHWCLQPSQAQRFSGKRVCELGAGRAGLAGLAVACAYLSPASSSPSAPQQHEGGVLEVLLTDGNEASVACLQRCVEGNRARFGGTAVSAELLRWDRAAAMPALAGRFDLLLCADCLFFEEAHVDLLHVMAVLLEPTAGEVIVVAPRRGHSLSNFVAAAEGLFHVTRCDNFDDHITALCDQAEASAETSGFKSDLHRPVLLRLVPRQRP
eukprot:m.95637 g.95637  ORF g.95637 m.95637 type:complete len:359 (+) comp15462_c0_seq1:191-1267(+)